MTTPYTILYQREPEGGYTVWVEELKGCVTYGETFEEATSMIYDAMQGYLDVLAEPSLRAKRGNLRDCHVADAPRRDEQSLI